MPHAKTKLAAAPAAPKQPERQPTRAQLREAETKRQFKVLEEFARMFHEEISITDFQALKTFKLILDRDRGCTTPVESFLVSLVRRYESRDNDGEGMTLEDIHWEMEQELTDGDALNDAVKQAHFLASRYPLPEETEQEAAQ